MTRFAALFVAVSCALGACASVTVTKVTDANKATAKGVRYYLPKPVLQFAPHADGTVSVSVLYLPDSAQQFAIDTNSVGSFFAYQVSLGPSGLLNAIEFKADTGIVGQQVASSAGGAAVQAFNMRQAEIVGAQSAVDTAQTALDSAKSNYDAATAKLQAAIAAGQASTTTEAISVAETQAKYLAAQQVLDRVKSADRAVAMTATAGTSIAGTGFTATASDPFKPQTWTPPTGISLPDAYGAVLYAVVEKNDTVSLAALKFGSATGFAGGVQPAFATIDVVPPGFSDTTLTFPKGTDVAVQFTRTIISIEAHAVTTDDGKTSVPMAIPVLRGDKRWLELDTSGFKPGAYELDVRFIYDSSRVGSAKTTFRLN